MKSHKHFSRKAILAVTTVVAGIILVLSACTNTGSGDQKKLSPIPDKLVVLTHDDRSKSWIQFVAPLLKEYGFNATFFVTEGLGYQQSEEHWITWDELKQIHEMGFEIGNHTKTHAHMSGLSKEGNIAELEALAQACREHGIPEPVTMAYPAGQHSPAAVEAVDAMGYPFSRRGLGPEYISSHRIENFRGPVYDPQVDHPLMIPATFSWGSKFEAGSPSDFSGTGGGGYDATFQDFVEAVKLARDGKIVVLCFHGVPDYYPHASTRPEDYAECMKYLHDEGYTVIALRDLAKYVDPNIRSEDPYEAINMRLEQMEAEDAI
jgi:peptidoglycan/xylan/chitin deacetylase (PgdA/CDA1 family)